MKRWAEMDKARIRAQEDQLKAAEAELAAIDKQIAEEKTSGSIGSIGSFGSGSVGEYQFLQAEQRRRQDAAEAKRMADEANRKRQAMVDEVARQTTILEELRDRLEPTTGV